MSFLKSKDSLSLAFLLKSNDFSPLFDRLNSADPTAAHSKISFENPSAIRFGEGSSPSTARLVKRIKRRGALSHTSLTHRAHPTKDTNTNQSGLRLTGKCFESQGNSSENARVFSSKMFLLRTKSEEKRVSECQQETLKSLNAPSKVKKRRSFSFGFLKKTCDPKEREKLRNFIGNKEIAKAIQLKQEERVPTKEIIRSLVESLPKRLFDEKQEEKTQAIRQIGMRRRQNIIRAEDTKIIQSVSLELTSLAKKQKRERPVLNFKGEKEIKRKLPIVFHLFPPGPQSPLKEFTQIQRINGDLAEPKQANKGTWSFRTIKGEIKNGKTMPKEPLKFSLKVKSEKRNRRRSKEIMEKMLVLFRKMQRCHLKLEDVDHFSFVISFEWEIVGGNCVPLEAIPKQPLA